MVCARRWFLWMVVLAVLGCADSQRQTRQNNPDDKASTSAAADQVARIDPAAVDQLAGIDPAAEPAQARPAEAAQIGAEPAVATEPQEAAEVEPAEAPFRPTHVVTYETPWYNDRPRYDGEGDAKLPAGTPVQRTGLATDGFWPVRTEEGRQGFIIPFDMKLINPAENDPDLATLVQGNTEFAVALYQQLRAQRGNLFFSPLSISTALGMLYGGARGHTEEEMARSLRFTLPQDKLHLSFALLQRELRGTRELNGYELSTANRIWVQRDYHFLPEYLAATRRHYGAEAAHADFASHAEAARQEINAWVERQTKDKIKELFKPEMIGPDTRIVLANAVYFKGDWDSPFNKARTRDANFSVTPTRAVRVPMMNQRVAVLFGKVDGHQIVHLPYAGDDVSMVLIVPKTEIEQLEAQMTPGRLAAWLKPLRREEVFLSMPKFQMTCEFQLNEVLAAMGMPSAFTDADFSGITGSRDLAISVVVHKAFIDVNEEGTEATAATGIKGARSFPETVAADRPFMFLIRDNRTGTILFMGRVSNPAE
jgi:serpin B